MALALQTKKIKSIADRKEKARKENSKRVAFKGKKFKDLNQAQKDKLLKACALRLGLLDDDGEDS